MKKKESFSGYWLIFFLLFLFVSFIGNTYEGANDNEILAKIATIFLILSIASFFSWAFEILFVPFEDFYNLFTHKDEHTDFEGNVRYSNFKDFFRYRVLGTLYFTIFASIVISCIFYIRPVGKTEYRVPKITYQINDEVIVKGNERKTVEYAYLKKVNEDKEYYDYVVTTDCKIKDLEDTAVTLNYRFTDGSTCKATSIKGIVKPKTTFWIIKSVIAGIKEFILFIYACVV